MVFLKWYKAIKTNPKGIPMANNLVKPLIDWMYLLFTPTDWNEELKPCKRCKPRKRKEKEYMLTLIGLSNLWVISW